MKVLLVLVVLAAFAGVGSAVHVKGMQLPWVPVPPPQPESPFFLFRILAKIMDIFGTIRELLKGDDGSKEFQGFQQKLQYDLAAGEAALLPYMDAQKYPGDPPKVLKDTVQQWVQQQMGDLDGKVAKVLQRVKSIKV